MVNLQDATLQVKEDEAPAKEDVKFNSGGSESFFMAQCDGNFIDPLRATKSREKNVPPTRSHPNS